MRQLPRPDDRETAERYNRAARVIAAWRRNKKFLDTEGQPAPLPIGGSDVSFTELVKRFSGDVPVRATLDELIRVGAVKRLEDGNICLLTRTYVPAHSDADKLHILGTDVALLISTIDHNLNPGESSPFFQRKVAYDNLPDEILPEFRKHSAKKAQLYLENLDRWLSKHDRDDTPQVKGSGRNQAGIGIYYFEEPYPIEEE